MPKIGYGSAKATKHVCPDGFKKVLVHNIKVENALILSTYIFTRELFNIQRVSQKVSAAVFMATFGWDSKCLFCICNCL